MSEFELMDVDLDEFVTVEQLADVFRVSSRQIQRFASRHGLPRAERGKYHLGKCLTWYARYLHAQVCGCDGACEGFDVESRDLVNWRAERKAAVRELVEKLPPRLAKLKPDAIRAILLEAVGEIYPEEKTK
jgi:hypothetical protein